MKCVEKDGVVKRVSDKKAADLITSDNWSYCPKSKWKEQKGGKKNKKK